MTDSLEAIVFARPFATAQPERERILTRGLNALTTWHRERCPDYARMLDAIFGGHCEAGRLEDVPWLPVRCFKHLELASVPKSAIARRLVSSGTSGQQVSQIFLDAETADLQVRALAAIVSDFVGRERRPMLIIDRRETVTTGAAFSARAAGIVGFSRFGREHTYALDRDMRPDWDSIERFIARHHDAGLLLFGFTFIVWQHFLEAARAEGRSLDAGPQSVLVHGGGWKRLADRAVNNDAFKLALAKQFGLRRVCNYYGMVEQVGSIFMECEAGSLHTPSFADAVVRDPKTLAPAASGVVEVLSLLPRSYPGHAILTEDLGTIAGCDDCACGRKGKRFHIHGRIPKAEMRGCSDARSA